MKLREALIAQTPSLTLQRAATDEIARLDAEITSRCLLDESRKRLIETQREVMASQRELVAHQREALDIYRALAAAIPEVNTP